MKPKALVAELFGTFSLTLAVLISVNNPGFPVPTPVIAGLTLGLFVYTIGPISGCHINPAVTCGLAAIRKIEFPTAGFYIVSQFAGALLALWLGSVIFGDVTNLSGAVVFLFGIGAVVLGLVPAAASGLVIGGSLLLGVSWAAHTTNGVLNPAVALGIGSFSAAYVWGPILGAVVGTIVCAYLAKGKAEAE
jgi:aquaporin Z